MRIVVTGATGNLGTSLMERLVRDPDVDEIIGIARRAPEPDAVGPLGEIQFVEADVATADLTPHFHGADVVVHLAWLFQPTHRPMITWESNALGSINVFDAAAAAEVPKLIHASSVGTYSPAPVDDRPVSETWPTHGRPTAAYGREKAYLERFLDAYEQHHREMRVVRMRPAFMFKRASASAQRRLFLGPLVPGTLVRPGRLPVLPHPAGMRLQALHTDDAAEAFRLAALGDAHGAFNLAAEPIVDARVLGEIAGTRTIALPRTVVRAAVSAAWRGHLVPADPRLLDLFLQLPLMDTQRAHDELGWTPRYSATEAIDEVLHGIAAGAGGTTPPLADDHPRRRVQELATGVGERP